MNTKLRLNSTSTRLKQPGRPNRLARDNRPSAAALRSVRAAVEKEFGALSGAQKSLVRLAINEAEALACSTPYPHLVFPLLAEEKVKALAAWLARQDGIRRSGPTLTFSA